MRTATQTAETPAPEVIFTMGLPGSGKSYVLGALGLLDTHTVLDSDRFMATHPDYDPKRPELLHAYGAAALETAKAEAFATGAGRWIVDGTGSNAERLVRNLREAKAAGFATRIIFVRVSLETALARNAARERTVPEAVITGKAKDIATSLELVQGEADVIDVIDNE